MLVLLGGYLIADCAQRGCITCVFTAPGIDHDSLSVLKQLLIFIKIGDTRNTIYNVTIGQNLPNAALTQLGNGAITSNLGLAQDPNLLLLGNRCNFQHSIFFSDLAVDNCASLAQFDDALVEIYLVKMGPCHRVVMLHFLTIFIEQELELFFIDLKRHL